MTHNLSLKRNKHFATKRAIPDSSDLIAKREKMDVANQSIGNIS